MQTTFKSHYFLQPTHTPNKFFIQIILQSQRLIQQITSFYRLFWIVKRMYSY